MGNLKIFSLGTICLSSFLLGIYSVQKVYGEDIGVLSFVVTAFLLLVGLLSNIERNENGRD